MSYRELLLKQKEPLSDAEIEDLGAWMQTLKSDCEMFGETQEDSRRIAKIEARIAKELEGKNAGNIKQGAKAKG